MHFAKLATANATLAAATLTRATEQPDVTFARGDAMQGLALMVTDGVIGEVPALDHNMSAPGKEVAGSQLPAGTKMVEKVDRRVGEMTGMMTTV